MKPYPYLNGLRELVEEISGTEKIHAGIRPYGFHAGSVMALVVYLYLLCKFLENIGKEPKLKFFVSENDWEQMLSTAAAIFPPGFAKIISSWLSSAIEIISVCFPRITSAVSGKSFDNSLSAP